MPVSIPTLDGKADYKVVTAIKALQAAVNTLEQRQTGDTAAELVEIRKRLDALAAQAAQTERLLQQIQKQVTQLTP